MTWEDVESRTRARRTGGVQRITGISIAGVGQTRRASYSDESYESTPGLEALDVPAPAYGGVAIIVSARSRIASASATADSRPGASSKKRLGSMSSSSINTGPFAVWTKSTR